MTEIITESPMGNLFAQIQERLKAEVPVLRYIDQDLGQLENYTTEPPVSWPCALIDMEDFDFSDTADNAQLGVGSVVIRIAAKAWSPTSNIAPSNIRNKGLEFYNVEQQVYKALQGWSVGGFKKLLRRSSKLEKRNDTQIRVRQIRFAVDFEDKSAKPARQSISTKLPVIGAS